MKTEMVIIGVAFYNESGKMTRLLKKFAQTDFDFPHLVVLVDDGSTDNSATAVKDFIAKERRSNFILLSNAKNRGVGYTIRRVIRYGIKHDFDVCVIMAGNGKDNPGEIPRLVAPIIKGKSDYVQGSRFLKGGSFKNLPAKRRILIKGFTFMMSLFTGFKCTDASDGFRAYTLSLFKDKRIDINQKWLDSYELETYLHYKVITLGYRIKEVPVSKDYLPGVRKYSKMKPFIGWWRMARPLLLLKFGLRS